MKRLTVPCTLLVALVPLVASASADEIDQLRQLYGYDQSLPLNVEQKVLYEHDGARVHDVTYDSPRGGRVTAYLVTPLTGKQPFVGIAFGHWGQGTRTEFLPEATLYAQAGAVSLLVDNPWVRPSPWRKPLKQVADPNNDREAFVQAVIDLRRGIDLLSARDDVDPKRLAYVGHSFGAQWGAILSAIESRLVTCVLVGGVPDAESIYRDGPDAGVAEFRATVPKEQQEAFLRALAPTSPIKYVAHSKVPLLFQFARHEQYFDQAAMDRYFAASIQPKDVKWYHAGHDLNDPSALVDRSQWLRQNVGIGEVRPILKAGLER
jgi:cephalosporin-C deacetylase-like acetyl esterase